MNAFVIIVLILLGLLFYFIPTLVAQDKRSFGGIFVLNLLLGWTFLGWVIALIWACTTDVPQAKVTVQPAKSDDKFDKLSKLKELLDKGAITETEYESEKGKLLL